MNREDAVKTLIDLGLGKGEAKTYVTLVLSGRAEASPLANLAGVPQPKIYEYLKNLINKGFVKQYATSGRAKLYEAISPKIVVSILQNKIEEKSKETIEFFENSKQSINLKEPALDVSVGRENVMIRLEDMIANAKADLVAQVDPDADFDAQDGLTARYDEASGRPGTVNIRDFDGVYDEITEMDAIIAYLQMTGTLVDFSTYEAEDLDNQR